MKMKEVKRIEAENKRHHKILPLLLWFLFVALMMHILNTFDDTNMIPFLTWMGVLLLAYFIGGFLMACYINTGSLNFFKFLVKEQPKPIVKPKVKYKLVKMLDEFKIEFYSRTGYHEYANTNKEGLDMFLKALNNKKLRFVRIPQIESFSEDVYHKSINVDNIGIVQDIQQSKTESGYYGSSPKDAKETIVKLLADGYVLKMLDADNDEAESAVEKLKKEFNFKGED